MKNIIYLFVITLVFTSCGDDPFSKVKSENVEQAAVRDNTPSKFPAVIETIKILEDSPLFNAGKGSVFNSEGKVENDASIMRRNLFKFGYY